MYTSARLSCVRVVIFVILDVVFEDEPRLLKGGIVFGIECVSADSIAMFESVFRWLLAYFVAYGVVIVVFACLLEGLLVGKFLPTEFIVPTAVLVSGGGLLESVVVLVAATIGTTAGQYIVFLIVRREGGEYVVSSPRIRVNQSHLDRAERYFDKYGLASVAVLNMVPLVRGWMTIPAGLSEESGRLFGVAAGVGNLVYHALFIVAGVGFGMLVM